MEVTHILTNIGFKFVEPNELEKYSSRPDTRFVNPRIKNVDPKNIDFFISTLDGTLSVVPCFLSPHINGDRIDSNVSGLGIISLKTVSKGELYLSNFLIFLEPPQGRYSKYGTYEDLLRAYYNSLPRYNGLRVATGGTYVNKFIENQIRTMRKEGAWVGRLDEARKEYKF